MLGHPLIHLPRSAPAATGHGSRIPLTVGNVAAG